MNPARKKIVFVISTLLNGGAERVLSRIANGIDKAQFNITIICLKKTGPNLEEMSDDIKVLSVEKPRIYFSIFRLYRAIIQQKPDIVFSWMGYINAYLSFFIPFFPKTIRWYCRESSIPSMGNRKYRLTTLFNFLYRFYNRYDKIICQSDSMALDLNINFKVKPDKMCVINNPIDFKQIDILKKQNIHAGSFPGKSSNGRVELLFVGTLSNVKRPYILPEIMKILPGNYYLTIIGDGPLLDLVQNKIINNGLENRIRIITGCSNPFPYYTDADCLLLCSEFEGFPNVIIESLASGCPAIGFNILGGAKEALNNYGGFFVDNSDLKSFKSKIISVCETEQLNRNEIIESCKKKYAIELIMEKYYSVLNNNIGCAGLQV